MLWGSLRRAKIGSDFDWLCEEIPPIWVAFATWVSWRSCKYADVIIIFSGAGKLWSAELKSLGFNAAGDYFRLTISQRPGCHKYIKFFFWPIVQPQEGWWVFKMTSISSRDSTV